MKQILQKPFFKAFFVLAFVMFFSQVSAQISENFQSWTSRGSYASFTQAGSGGAWNGVSVIVAPTAGASGTGSAGSVQLKAGDGILTLPSIISGGVGTITLQAKFSSSNGGFSIEKNINGTGWTNVQSFTSSATTAVQFQASVNDGSANLQLRIVNTGGSGNRAITIYDVVTTIGACAAPTTQASAITFSSATVNSFQVNWINGSGAGRIVKINTSNSFTAPVNGSDPTAAASYAGGEQVLYNGTGDSVIVTDLSPSTNYYLRVYEYCSTGRTYQTATAANNPNSAATIAATSPILSISEPQTNHGSLCIGTPGTTIQYTITNNSLVAADGVSVTSADTQFAVTDAPTTIAANGTATYSVTFTPSSAGNKTADITVTSTTSGSNSPTSSLTGTGLAAVVQTVSSSAATLITGATATLNGTVTALGVCPASTARGFVYSKTADNSDPLIGGANVTDATVTGLTTGTFSSALTDLTIGAGYSFKAYVFDGTNYVYGAVTTFATAPLLAAATGATVDAPFQVTFAANPTWETNVTGITVNGTALTAGYTIGSGVITFTPSESAPAGLLQTAGTNKTIVVSATGYSPISVSQTIAAGAPVKLIVLTQPAAPAANGGTLGAQPIIAVADQYGNQTGTAVTITAAADALTWTLEGNDPVAAVSGTATFSGLTATSDAAVSNAAIIFSAAELTSVTSASFNIPGPDFISLDAFGVAKVEDFDTLANSGTGSVTPQGWFFFETGTSGNTTYAAGTGSDNGGNTYSFGSSGSSERAFGTLLSGSVTSTIGAKLKNNTGGTISSVTISYIGEKWRIGALDRADSMDFSYSTDATSLSTGTWTSVTALDYSTNAVSGSTGATDGNAAQNKTSIAGSFEVNVPAGSAFWVRFSDNNATGSDDGLAIDDFNISACQELTATVSNNSPLCAGSDAIFNIAGSANATVFYSLNGIPAEVVLPENGIANITVNSAIINQMLVLQSVSLGGCSRVLSATSTIEVNTIPTFNAPADQVYCADTTTSAIALTGTPSGVTFDITGGSAVGLADQTGVTSVPAFAAIAGTATISVTPMANGCTGTAVSYTIIVSPATVGGAVTASATTLCQGSTSGLLSLSEHVGNVLRWESSVAPFSVWTPIANTDATYTSGALAQTTRFRAVVKSGECMEVNSGEVEITINQVTFSSVTSAEVCLNTDAIVTVNGLVPNSAAVISYTKSGVSQTPVLLTADATGSAYFNVPVTGAGQNVVVTSIQRTDVAPSCTIMPTTNNRVNFVLSTGCAAVTTCGITLPTIDAYVYTNIVANAQSYTWRVTTLDENGQATAQVQSNTTVLRNLKLTSLGSYAFKTTYRIEVSVKRNNVQGPYGTACNVTTPEPKTALANCDATLTSINDIVYANLISFATGYAFRITETEGEMRTQTVNKALRSVKLTDVTAFPILYGATYSVEVAVRNTDGTYLDFGTLCMLHTPVYPSVFLEQCATGGTVIPSNSTQIYASSYANATGYIFNISNADSTYNHSVAKVLRVFKLSDFPALAPGEAYSVRVKLLFNGETQDSESIPSGKPCTIITPLAGKLAAPSKGSAFNAVAYPNPFAENFNIDVTTANTDKVSVKVYDMTGRLLESHTDTVSEFESLKVGDRYPAGVYNVIVTQGDNIKTLRVIKR